MSKTPAWFDYKVYFANKIDELAKDGYGQYNDLSLAAAFKAAGYTIDNDGAWKHFEDFGNSENVSPTSYFDADYYYMDKASKFFDKDIELVTDSDVKYIKDAFAKAGLSAWDHYNKWGMLEGIDPNANFSTDKYFEDKLQELKDDYPGSFDDWTVEDVKQYFHDHNYNAITHYLEHGINEGLTPKPASHANTVQELTVNPDNMVGTQANTIDDGDIVKQDDFNDNFKAEEGTLQSRDTVDGLGGVDTLYAIVNADRDGSVVKAGSLNPTVKNVEKVLFQSQIGDGDEVVNKAPVSAVIDADRISLAHKGEDGYTTDLTLGSVNSRADLRIEDVRHNSNETVIRFADADPEIDFNVYFNARYLKAEGGSSSDTKLLILEDVKNAQINSQPLSEQPYDQLKFNYISADGTTTFVLLDMTKVAEPSEYQTETATYDSLVAALNKAKTAWLAEHTDFTGEFTITKGANYHAEAVAGNVKYQSDMGEYIVLTAVNGTLDTTSKGTGWDIADGSPAPVDGGVVRGEDTASSSDCPLIITKVELDNVAQVNWWSGKDADCIPDNDVLGSHAGDLQIGDMSMRGGIERMDVTVDRGSWLSALLSTNNTLRYVKVTAGDINGDNIVGDDADHTGSLYIGDWDGKLDKQGDGRGHITKNVDTNLTWTDKARLLTAKYDIDEDDGSAEIAGLHDVAVFDATDEGKNLYKGNINIAAEFGASAYDKYFKFVDGSKGVDKMPPLPKYDGKFAYLTGTGNDTINMTVNGGVAADNDFVMNIATNAGDDLVAFQYADMSAYQSYDNKKLQQVKIDTGDGEDTVWFYAGKMAENPEYDPDNIQVAVPKYIIDEDGGAVTVKAGADKDAIYVNQVDLMEGGTGSGVTWGPDAYNAVFVFNAQDTTVGFDDGKFNGATNSNDIATGPRLFYADRPTEATNLWVKVNFKGFTSQVQFKAIDKDAYSVTATEINQAIINAVENNDTLCKLISAKDGAGYSLIIESLINGEMTLNDLTITFQEAKNAEAAKIAPDVAVTGSNGGNAWYATQFGTAPLPEDAAADAEPVPYIGNDDHVRSQAVVNGGTQNDVIVLGNNGITQEDGGMKFTFKAEGQDVDYNHARVGNTISVTLGTDTYTSTYEADTGWSDFVSGEGETQTKLSDKGWKLKEDPTTASGKTTFTATVKLDAPKQAEAGSEDQAVVTVDKGDGTDLTVTVKAVAAAAAGEVTWDGVNMDVDDGLEAALADDGVTLTVTYIRENTNDPDNPDKDPTFSVEETINKQTKEPKAEVTSADSDIYTEVTFSKTDEDAEDLSDGEAVIGAGAKSDLAQPDTLAGKYTATISDVPVPTAANEELTVTVTVDGTAYAYTAEADATPAWPDTFTAPVGAPDSITVAFGADKTTVTATYTRPADSDAEPEFAASKDGTDITTIEVAESGPFTTTIEGIDLTDAQTGNAVEVTVDGVIYTSEITVGGTEAAPTYTFGKFVDSDGKELDMTVVANTADPAQATLTLTTPATATSPDVTAAAIYLGDPDECSDPGTPIEGEDTPYWNTGLDIVELSADFGDDVVTDFQTGVDKVNVHDLLGKDVDVAYDAANALSALKDMSVFIAEYNKGDAITGIVEQTTVTADFGTVIKLADEATKAVVFLHDTSAEDNNVYTVAVVTSSGASVQGSLTLAKDDVTPEQLVLSADVCDIIGVESELIPDPVA